MEFSKEIKEFLAKEYPDKDIYSMSIEELKAFKTELINKRQEYGMLELSFKLLGNAAYGASANHHFYFYNVQLAGDITGECRNLTKTMWANLENFFHEELWNKKDLQAQFGFELDESKHDWYRKQPISIYSDTDSLAENSFLSVKDNKNIENQISIKDLFNQEQIKFGTKIITENNQEIIESNYNVLNYTQNNEIDYVPIKYIMRHKVSKAKFKIKTKTGKEIIVTDDHSCVVFRNKEKIIVKAKDINKDTDKILTVINEKQ